MSLPQEFEDRGDLDEIIKRFDFHEKAVTAFKANPLVTDRFTWVIFGEIIKASYCISDRMGIDKLFMITYRWGGKKYVNHRLFIFHSDIDMDGDILYERDAMEMQSSLLYERKMPECPLYSVLSDNPIADIGVALHQKSGLDHVPDLNQTRFQFRQQLAEPLLLHSYDSARNEIENYARDVWDALTAGRDCVQILPLSAYL